MKFSNEEHNKIIDLLIEQLKREIRENSSKLSDWSGICDIIEKFAQKVAPKKCAEYFTVRPMLDEPFNKTILKEMGMEEIYDTYSYYWPLSIEGHEERIAYLNSKRK